MSSSGREAEKPQPGRDRPRDLPRQEPVLADLRGPSRSPGLPGALRSSFHVRNINVTEDCSVPSEEAWN